MPLILLMAIRLQTPGASVINKPVESTKPTFSPRISQIRLPLSVALALASKPKASNWTESPTPISAEFGEMTKVCNIPGATVITSRVSAKPAPCTII